MSEKHVIEETTNDMCRGLCVAYLHEIGSRTECFPLMQSITSVLRNRDAVVNRCNSFR